MHAYIYVYVYACMLMYAYSTCISMSVSDCAHPVSMCECVLAPWPCLFVGPWGAGGRGFLRGAVMGDWSGGDGGSRFHWAFYYRGLAADITVQRVCPARCLRFNTRKKQALCTSWDEKV